jgi:hypothetical protein
MRVLVPQRMDCEGIACRAPGCQPGGREPCGGFLLQQFKAARLRTRPRSCVLSFLCALSIVEPSRSGCPSASRDDRRQFAVRCTEGKQRLYEQVEGHSRIAGYVVVNFGRRSYPEPGQNCTPINSAKAISWISADMIRDAQLHRRRDAQGFLYAAEVVVHHVQRDGRAMV